MKIIVEVSEDFIREHADAEKMQKRMEESGKQPNILKALADMIAFGAIEKQIDKGVTEIIVNREDFTEDKVQFFDQNIGDVCMMAHIASDCKEEK